LLVSSGFISSETAGKNKSAFVKPIPTPLPEIEKFELDRNKIFLPCEPGLKPREKCDDTGTIKVEVSAANPRNGTLAYHYTVSGGRIVGKGAGVSWDLRGVRPGTYTITVGLGDDSEVYQETQTKTVQVKECNCLFVDACPVIEVSTPNASVKAGRTVMFTAKVPGISASGITYNWTVSAGTITEGQGTPQIKVETTREMADGSLTASVQISSERVASICETSASETVSITKQKPRKR